jgi:hypothetical protein
MAWSLAMFREEAILSRWEPPRSPFAFNSPSTVGSTGFDGGCKAGSGGGGTTAWGGSAGLSSAGFALGFRAALGIKNKLSSLAGILFPHNTRQSFGRPKTEKIQNGLFLAERFED